MKNRQLLLTAANILIGILTAQASSLRIYLGNDFSTSTTRIYFTAGSHSGFDQDLDKKIRKVPENKMNYIYTLADDKTLLFENHRPLPGSYSAIDLQIAVKEVGTFSFTLEDVDNDMENMQYALTDICSGVTIPVSPGFSKELTFGNSDINTKKNYVLHIFHKPVIASSPVSCNENRDGAVSVSFNNTENWEARLKTSAGSFATAHVETKDESARFAGLEKGIYTIEVWKSGVLLFTDFIAVEHPALLRPEFSVVSDTLAAGEPLFAENLSGTGTKWYWNFGDESDSKQLSPSHYYELPGTYKLTLTISDAAGCTASASKNIVVESGKISTTIVRGLMSN